MTPDFREDAYGEKMKARLGWTLQAPARWRLSDVLFAVAVGLMVFCWSYFAHAQVPPAQTPKECDAVAEIVLTARALEKNDIRGEKARVLMADFYAAILDGPNGERAAKYVAAALQFASRPEHKDTAPVDLASNFEAACRENRGDLSAIFGTDS